MKEKKKKQDSTDNGLMGTKHTWIYNHENETNDGADPRIDKE